MSTWEQETSEAVVAAGVAAGASVGDLRSERTSLGWRVSLDDGDGRASINVDLIEGCAASVEVRAFGSWVKDFDTNDDASRRAVGVLLEAWFRSVVLGEVAVREHRLWGVTVTRDLIIDGSVALVAGVGPLRGLATSHVETTFPAYGDDGPGARTT